MFFRIERNDFVEVLAKASKVVPGKGDDHLRALHLSCEQGSDGPLTVRATGGGVEFTAEAQAGVVAEGSAVVLGTGLHKLVKSLAAGEIAVEAEEDVVNVSQGKDVYRLPLAGSKYDPDFSPFPEKGAV